MKHLIGRLYYKAPIFLAVRCDSPTRALVYNILTGVVVVGVVVAIVATR